jgi:hypothetical protein
MLSKYAWKLMRWPVNEQRQSSVRFRGCRVDDQHRVHGRCVRDGHLGGEGLKGEIISGSNAVKNGVEADR